MKVVPVGLALTGIVEVPAVTAFRFLVGAVGQSRNEGAEPLAVVGMDLVVTHLYANIIAENRLSV